MLNHNAVYHANTALDLQVCKSGHGEFNTLGKPAPRGGEVNHIERVQTIRLDDYVREHRIDRVDLMKIDVEGAEDFALRGAKNLLSSHAAPILSIEFSARNCKSMGYDAEVIRERLQDFGYSLFSFAPESHMLTPFPENAEHAEGENVTALKSPESWPGVFT